MDPDFDLLRHRAFCEERMRSFRAHMEEMEEDNDEEDEDEEMEDEDSRLALLICLAVKIQAARVRAEQRRRHRFYLTRPELLPNPRFDTPWQILYNSRSDRAWITTMGFDCATFDRILEGGFAERWDSRPIPRNDVSAMGQPRLGRRSLDAAGGLGLVLHYLNSTMREISLQQIFALIPTTVARYVNFALDLLLETLKEMPDARIAWPNVSRMAQLAKIVQSRHSELDGAFGTTDGLNLPLGTSSDDDWENAMYNGWLHGHFISNVLVFSAIGEILCVVLNAPGSYHDARIAQNVYKILRDRTPDGYYLVADTAFPRGTRVVQHKIRVPLKEGERAPARLLKYYNQLVSFRQAAEWGMRAIQGSFGRLRLPLDANDGRGRHDLLLTCFHLHQLRVRLVGINQLRNVYDPIWRETAEMRQVWDGLETMIFGQIKRADRVAKFYHHVLEEL